MEDGLVLGPGAEGCRRHLDDDDDGDDDGDDDDDDDDDDDGGDDPHRALAAPVRVRLADGFHTSEFCFIFFAFFEEYSAPLLNPPHGKHPPPTENRIWLRGPNATPPKLL